MGDRFLNEFSIQAKSKSHLFSCVFKRTAARIFDTMASIHSYGNADELRDHMEAILCIKAPLSALQKKVLQHEVERQIVVGFCLQ